MSDPGEPNRCAWAANGGPLERAYHDDEWGSPVHDDRVLFEFLILEGAQAGLSWSTILRKRESYRRAFAGFEPGVVAAFDERGVARLLQDEGIVRNRAKIASAIGNAAVFLALQDEFGSFDRYVSDFAPDAETHRRPRTMQELPATSVEGDRLSKDLRRRGMRFVGPTIIYAYMQAVGLVDDHVVGCFRASHPAATPGAVSTPRRKPGKMHA